MAFAMGSAVDPSEVGFADWVALTELQNNFSSSSCWSSCAPRCSTLHIFSSMPPSFRYVALTHILAPISSTCKK